MIHRFLLVSSQNGVDAVTGAQPQVFILPPGDAQWTQIDAANVQELGRGWYQAEIGDRSGDGRLIVVASAAGTLEWRDVVDLDRASLVTAAAKAESAAAKSDGAVTKVQESMGALNQAADAAKDALKLATETQAGATDALNKANATAEEALALLQQITEGGGSPTEPPDDNEIITKKLAAWLFHDPGDAFTRKNVDDGVELVCKRVPNKPAQLYDYNYVLAGGRYQLVVKVEGTPGARFRFEVLQHGSPFYGLGKSPAMEIGGDTEHVLELKNDNNARLRLWFTGMAKSGDRYLIKEISLKKL